MAESKATEGEWVVPVSGIATATINPIRQIVDKIVMPKASPEKPIIPLSIGDPAVFGNLDVPQIAIESLAEKVCFSRFFSLPTVERCRSLILQAKVKKYHGYAPSAGWLEAREAVAQKYNTPESPVTAAGGRTFHLPCSYAASSRSMRWHFHCVSSISPPRLYPARVQMSSSRPAALEPSTSSSLVGRNMPDSLCGFGARAVCRP